MRAALRLAPLSLCLGIVLFTSPAAAGETLVPGDVNCDAHVDISDAVFLLSYLYLGAGPPCPLGDRPELLAQGTDLEGKVAQLEAAVAAGVQKLADQAAEATASEAALLAQLDAKGSALQAKADELAACRAELQAWKENHFEECRNR